MEALRVMIGEINGETSFFRVMLCVSDAGIGTIQVYSCEHKKDRGGYLILDAQRWAELKELIAKADATIERLKKSGELKFVAEGFQLAGE